MACLHLNGWHTQKGKTSIDYGLRIAHEPFKVQHDNLFSPEEGEPIPQM